MVDGVPIDLWHEISSDGYDLPWAGLIDVLLARRCRARLKRPGLPRPRDEPYFGRCELRAHSRGIAHALERGMENVRWQETR